MKNKDEECYSYKARLIVNDCIYNFYKLKLKLLIFSKEVAKKFVHFVRNVAMKKTMNIKIPVDNV